VTVGAALVASCSSGGPPLVLQPPPPEVDRSAAAAERPDTAVTEAASAVESVETVPDTVETVEGEPEPELPADTLSPAEALLRSMSLREKVGQMMMPIVLGDFAPEGTPSHDRIMGLVEEAKIGGLIVSVGSPTDVAVKLNDFQRHAEIPLLVAADLETGAGFRMKGAVHLPTNILLGGATDFPSLMALGATGDAGLAYEMGRITAVEARAVGVHVPFAPVLDVNSNPENPIINVRSLGEDPAEVARLGSAFVRGIEDHGGIATGKHFPGHGDTETDSHLELPIIRADRMRLDSVELRPFQEAIDAGMSGLMTAHIAVPALNGGTEDPATLSGRILTDLLRERMDFRGLLFTDAMDMGAIVRRFGREESAVRAVESGADVILMPPSPTAAVDGIVAAVREGRLPEERIDESVLRILRVKERMGLFDERHVEVDSIPGKVGIPAHVEVAEEIARRSITLLRNEGDLLPLRGTRSARVLSVTYRRDNDLLAGRWFDGRLRSTYPRLNRETVGRDTGADVFRGLLREAGRSDLVVVSLYVTAVSYSGSVALPERAVEFLNDLSRAGVPHVVISFGNPYLLREFPDVRSYLLAWSGAEASQKAAADALLGRFEITGRTPTRIPPFFEIGDGIRLPARERR
jgi:beta-N-acetylhexosaminidase